MTAARDDEYPPYYEAGFAVKAWMFFFGWACGAFTVSLIIWGAK